MKSQTVKDSVKEVRRTRNTDRELRTFSGGEENITRAQLEAELARVPWQGATQLPERPAITTWQLLQHSKY